MKTIDYNLPKDILDLPYTERPQAIEEAVRALPHIGKERASYIRGLYVNGQWDGFIYNLMEDPESFLKNHADRQSPPVFIRTGKVVVWGAGAVRVPTAIDDLEEDDDVYRQGQIIRRFDRRTVNSLREWASTWYEKSDNPSWLDKAWQGGKRSSLPTVKKK